jgi:hypothetical protein
MKRESTKRRASTLIAGVIAVAIVLLIGMVALPFAFWLTDSSPEFVEEQVAAFWNDPNTRPDNARNLRQWYAWRLGARSQPPDDYTLHELIKLITETVGASTGSELEESNP